jgi:adenosylcobyric acid synthase
MIQGTGSGAGKSLIAAALCRVFRDQGIDVAPFKSQNMALNSFITAEGGEIGRAQALQARAAGVEPSNDMNPVLLKVSGDSGCQVIIQGRVHATMKAREYYAFRDTAWKYVTESFGRLSRKHELIVMEGAGSPAEINLAEVDIVNMSMAKHAKAPVLLVGDIDRGGVFASLYGTVKLLGRDSRHIKAFIINKFRGDRTILDPGLDMILERTGKPVIGVLPYIQDIGLPEEDGLALARKAGARGLPSNELIGGQGSGDSVKIVIVRLKYISNFTDFDPLELEPGVEVVYSDNPVEIENADVVIVPGSKNTVPDLLLLKEKHLDDSIRKAYEKGVQIIGICGGYQMLGKKIEDPHGAESHHKSVAGIGLLNIETRFEKEKTTCLVEAEMNSGAWVRGPGSRMDNCKLTGYEIHMGASTGDIGLFHIRRSSHPSEIIHDGSMNGNCWGTYIHGIFENDSFRRAVINHIRAGKGLSPATDPVCYNELQERALDRLAAVVRENIDMDFVQGMLRR